VTALEPADCCRPGAGRRHSVCARLQSFRKLLATFLLIRSATRHNGTTE